VLRQHHNTLMQVKTQPRPARMPSPVVTAGNWSIAWPEPCRACVPLWWVFC